MAEKKKKPTTCKTRGCSRPRYCKDLCSAHYAAERRKDPAVLERAREASKRSYAKHAAERKAEA